MLVSSLVRLYDGFVCSVHNAFGLDFGVSGWPVLSRSLSETTEFSEFLHESSRFEVETTKDRR